MWVGAGVALALVLLASTADPLGGDVSRGDAFLVVVVVAAFAAVPTGFVRLWRRRRAVAVALGVLALLVLLAFVLPKPSSRLLPSTGGTGGRTRATPAQPRPPEEHARAARDASHWILPAWLAALLAALLVALVVAAVVVLVRRGTEPAVEPDALPTPDEEPEPELTPERLYSLLDDSLEDLRAEPDPRAAVVSAYARMERGLAGFGVRRRPSDAPLEFLSRALARLSVSGEAAHRLTTLFERCRFSPAPVDESMKEEAIAALEAIKEEVGSWAGAR